MTDPTPVYLCLLLAAFGVGAWFYGQGQAVRLRLAEGRVPHSRSPFHGALCAAASVLVGSVVFVVGWTGLSASIADRVLWAVGMIGSMALTALLVGRRAGPAFRARVHAERLMRAALLAVASLGLVVTFAIILTLLIEALLFFGEVSVLEFLFGTQWSPQTALREDQTGQSGVFGSLPVFSGTLLITAIALVVATPIGLMIAVYLSEYASRRQRGIVKPVVEVLAGIPPVVYGFFALLTVGPLIRELAAGLGLSVPAQSALAAGLVMGLMILPLISSLSDDVLSAVPQSLRDGSLALGATPSETVRGVVVPRALPGLAGAVLLATSRAIGETMIVVMAAGRAADLTANPLDTVTTVTVQIVALVTGDQVFDSAKTRAAFALGLVLFALTLLLNIAALLIVRRVRERFRDA